MWRLPASLLLDSRSRTALRVLAAVLAASTMQGCLYTGGRTVRTVGPRISESAVKAIEPGRTTDEWLVATFGEPNNRVCTTDGAEILRYDCDTRTTEGSYVFMLFATTSNTIERTCWWFELRDGRVERAWSDSCDPVCITPTAPPPDEIAPELPPSDAAGY
jgi:hypothetical protein